MKFSLWHKTDAGDFHYLCTINAVEGPDNNQHAVLDTENIRMLQHVLEGRLNAIGEGEEEEREVLHIG